MTHNHLLKMLPLLLMAVLLLGSFGDVHAQPGMVTPIIAAQGVFAVSDGSSVFQFRKDGVFVLEPVGISGRTVQGTWKQTSPNKFTIVGQWSWVNGISATNDYRRMKVYLSYHGEPAQKASVKGNIKIHPCYFVIEELTTISKAEFDKAHSP